MSANPTSPYDDLDSAGPGFSGLGDEASDDDLCSPSGSFSASGEYTGQIPILVACPDPMTLGNANSKAAGSSGQGQNVMGKSAGTNNFVSKLHQ